MSQNTRIKYQLTRLRRLQTEKKTLTLYPTFDKEDPNLAEASQPNIINNLPMCVASLKVKIINDVLK